MGSRFLFTTFGSLGDLHPYLAVALGLRDRGHTVTLATSEIYRAKVLGEGLRFHSLRPDLGHVLDSPEVMRKAFHPRRGSEYIMRELMLPFLGQMFEDTMAAARDADLLVGHGIAFATPMVAEILRKKWLSIALQPMVLLSKYDPPAISGAAGLTRLHGLGPPFWGPALRLVRRIARSWGAPLNQFRKQLGLGELKNPLLDDMFSPFGTQAWFSKVFARRQPDWPVNVTVTGFPFYDRLEAGRGLDPGLRRFLDAGPPPVVFTLGSAAVFDAGCFYTESLKAVRALGCRAVLLTGRDARNVPAGPVPETVCVAEYAPYSELLPRAAATVHQGGVGTTAQALRAGRPMLVVPYSHDQPDNGLRIARLGVGRVIPRAKYTAARAAAELKALLADNAFAGAAARVAQEMAGEDGVRCACDGLEAALPR